MTILGIAIGVSVSVAIRSANVDVLHSFQSAVSSVAGQATLEVRGGELGFDERIVIPLRQHPDIVTATPMIRVGAMMSGNDGDHLPLEILALDLLEAPQVKNFEFTRGVEEESMLEVLLDPSSIFIGEGLAHDLKLAKGSPLQVVVGTRTHTFIVQGLIRADRGVPTVWDRMAVMDIAAAQYQFNLVGRLDRIDLIPKTGRSLDGLIESLQATLPPTVTVDRPSRRSQQVERMIRAFQFNLTTLSAVGLLVGLLLVYNTVSYSVVKRYREIGIYRALGMGRGGVVTLFLLEAAVMGIVGGLLGGWLGIMLARYLIGFLSQSVSELYVAVPLVEQAGGGRLLTVLAESSLLGMVVSMLGALAPSREAGRTEPVKALAPGHVHEAQQVQAERVACWGLLLGLVAYVCTYAAPVRGVPLFGYLAAFCLLLGCALLIPLWLKGFGKSTKVRWGAGPSNQAGRAIRQVAADQVSRAMGRNSVTVAALMIGVSIMVGVGVMIQSFRVTVEHWIDQTIMADLIIAPTGWPVGVEETQGHRLPLAFAEELKQIPGVAAVDTYRSARIEIQNRPVSIVSRDLQVHGQWSRYLFVSGDSTTILEKTRQKQGVILSEVLAQALQVEQGEELEIDTPAGSHSFPIMGIFYDYATDGGKVVLDRALYQQYWSDNTTTVIPLYLQPGVSLNQIQKHIQTYLRDDFSFTVIKNQDIKSEILEIFDRTFTVTYALEFIAVAIAMLGIANTVLTSILERQREFATLRAIGGSQAQVRALVLWETGYLGTLGAGIGIIAGLLLSVLLIEVINRQSFGWTIRLAFSGGLLVEAMVLALAAALIAGLLPALWASRQSIVDGLRYE